MKFRQKLCPLCPNGLMKIHRGEKGFYYRCNACLKEPGENPAPEEPIFLKFIRQPATAS